MSGKQFQQQENKGDSNSTFFTTVLKDNPIRNVALHNVVILTGQATYETWSIMMIIIWRTMGLYELIVDGVKSILNAEKDEVRAYTVLRNAAIGTFVQVVHTDILKVLLERGDPHLMWTYIVTEYKRDTAYALVNQLGNLCQLFTAYDSVKPLSEFIQMFESEWYKLYRLARDSNEEHRQDFANFLQKDLVKRDFLLDFLSLHKKNVVDNLTTKTDLTFAVVKQRLLDIDTEKVSHTALATGSMTSKKPVLTRPSRIIKTITCSYCRKHHPKSNLNHKWYKCLKLKEFNEKKIKNNLNKGQMLNNSNEAMITSTSEEMRYKNFYLDTCASTHMCPYSERFSNLQKCTGFVNSSSGELMEILGKGTVILNCKLKSNVYKFVMKDVLYVPKLQHPLFSWRKERSNGFTLLDNGDTLCILKNNEVCVETNFNGPLPIIKEELVHNHENAFMTYEFWHKALCHSAPSSIEKTEKLIKNNLIPECPKDFHCEACELSKSTHKKPKAVERKTTARGEYIHSDLCGPFPIPSLGSALYYISFVDDATRYSTVRFLKAKFDASQTIINLINEFKNQFGCQIKAIRTDNGGEYINERLTKYLAQEGIVHVLTPPYSPESNGVAERLNRSVGEGIRAMLIPISEKRLWAEAVQTFIYTKNRLSHSSVSGQTPYEAFYKQKPTINHLQPFGRQCYVHIPKAKRSSGSKLLPRAEKGIFVGYTNVLHQYRIFTPENGRIVVSADVKFPPLYEANDSLTISSTHQQLNPDTQQTNRLTVMENPTQVVESTKIYANNMYSNDADNTVDHNPNSQLQELSPTNNESSNENNIAIVDQSISRSNAPIITRSNRHVRPRVFDDTITGEWWKKSRAQTQALQKDSSNIENTEEYESAYISLLEISEPRSYNEAKNSPYWSEWEKAFEDEMKSLHENEVWQIVPRPKDRSICSGKWVCKVKGNALGEVERFKARYVAKGYSQTKGIDYDETFAPVVRLDSLRLLLAFSAHKGWKPRQLDIKTAFLYGILNEEIYMELPEGYRKENHVARLKRCIYGLKQSPREWYFRLVEYIIPQGFVSTLMDPCVLIHKTGKLIIAIYVDDIILFGEQCSIMDETVNLLKTEFKVNDMGDLHWLLGIQIEYTNAGIILSQMAYIDRILNRFTMQDSNPVSTPIDVNQRLIADDKGDVRVNATLYQKILGSIMYLVSGTRPDLAYTITHLSQFNTDPSVTHLNAAKRVLRYLKGTRELKLLYKFNTPLVLNGYCDASYANCLDTRRSFSGYIFQLGESTFSWKARKQRTVADSTCEAEYMALKLATKQFIWIVRGLHQFAHKDIPTALFTDNTAAIDLANNPRLNDATKHIDTTYHFTRERVADGTLTLLHIPSADNLADICTKGLPSPRLNHLCTSIFGTKVRRGVGI